MGIIKINRYTAGQPKMAAQTNISNPIYADISLPVEASLDTDTGKKVLVDQTNAETYYSMFGNFFHKDGGVGKVVYCFPGLGSLAVDYFKNTTKSAWTAQGFQNALATDMKQFSDMIINSTSLDTDSAVLTAATEITLNINFILPKVDGTTVWSWSGIIYQETQVS